MNLFQSGECVKFFLELYPSATVPQLEALRDEIGLYEVEDFEREARGVLIEKSFVNDAIPALIDRLKRGKVLTAERQRTWVDEENDRVREECQKVMEQFEQDDELLSAIPPAAPVQVSLIAKAMAEVIAEQAEPVRSIWLKKGLAHRGLRCAVAERLRKFVVTEKK